MIDLHCHILPGIDDGPEGLEGALALAELAYRQGMRSAVATPHWAERAYRGDGAEVKEGVSALQGELQRRELGLELRAGLEVQLSPEVPALVAEGRLLTLNGSRYLLVELPFQRVPAFAEQTLFELQLGGVVPVIAHPERNAEIAENPDLLLRLVERGVLAQVTAGSLEGAFGGRVRRAAELLVRRQLVQMIASDAHSVEDRPPSFEGALRRAAGLVGEEAALAMATTVPAAILADQEVFLPPPHPPQRRPWFSFPR